MQVELLAAFMSVSRCNTYNYKQKLYYNDKSHAGEANNGAKLLLEEVLIFRSLPTAYSELVEFQNLAYASFVLTHAPLFSLSCVATLHSRPYQTQGPCQFILSNSFLSSLTAPHSPTRKGTSVNSHSASAILHS